MSSWLEMSSIWLFIKGDNINQRLWLVDEDRNQPCEIPQRPERVLGVMPRDKDIKYYSDDPVILLKGVWRKASQQSEEIGIKTIGELKKIELTIKHGNLPKGWKVTKLTQFSNKTQLASNQKTWIICHDALSIMTSKVTKKWTEQKDYLERWIWPSTDLYDNSPTEARRFYDGKSVGNSPKFMPLDTYLNQDLHCSHDFHSIITQDLLNDHPQKFDRFKPKQWVTLTIDCSIQIRESLYIQIKL